MEYGKIIAVTGLPGLFELLSSKNDGAIVRSLEDKSTRFVSSRVHNFSHLESIEVFTVKDNVNLVDIFHAMEKEGGKAPDGKDGAALKKYFEKVYPDLDFGRVYSSDLKKMAKWFEVLKDNNVEIKLTELPEEEEAETVEPADEASASAKATVDEVVKAAPKKKAEPKKASPDTEAPAKASASAKATADKAKAAPKKKAEPKKASLDAEAPAKTSTSAKATADKAKAAPKKK